ncbi:phosphoribosyltransferase family protein [Geitlerinema splendidum]|nr:phosphoribosyltransferase family protein [Geitlerinema splendidum]
MSSGVLFRDRAEAGQQLASVIAAEFPPHTEQALPIVYALPRGGLPIAEPIAQQLRCPLSAIVAKKITRPKNPELAIGAVTADGQVLWAGRKLAHILTRMTPHRLTLRDLWRLKAQKKAQDQWVQLAPWCPSQTATGAIALIVDDGIATGMTMAVAVKAVRTQNPAQIWICTPVAPQSLMPDLQAWSDRVIVLATPDPFYSVSRFYRHFPQVEMAEAIACLQQQEKWRYTG